MHTKRRTNNNMNGGGNNGGQHRHNNNNRPRRFTNNNNRSNGGADDAAGIARTRRNAIQSREKYQLMARDALSMSDRVLAENYLQHADHYHRVLLALPPEEIRQPFVPREPGSAEHQGGDGQGNGQGHDGMDQSAHQQPQVSQELPSFITQPAAQTNPEE